MSTGKVYLVGAGPGDPKLITIRGSEYLSNADVVIYDYLVNPKLLNIAKSSAELIPIGGEMTQSEINEMLICKAEEGKLVVRLKGGDPFIFGRGGEEAESLADAKIPLEIVPGVTAAIGSGAYAGIPLTHRKFNSTVTFVTGHEDPKKLKSNIDWSILSKCGTLVFYMGVENLAGITKKLIEHCIGGCKSTISPETNAAIVEQGTLPGQKTITGNLKNIARKAKKAKIKPPALLFIGENVKLRKKLQWYEKRPLFGKKIVVTRSKEQIRDITNKLENLGAEVIEFPTIKIMPPESWAQLDKALDNITHFNWIIFTSSNAVDFFFQRLCSGGCKSTNGSGPDFIGTKNKDIRDLKGIKICAIGAITAKKIEDYGLKPDLIPEKHTTAAIANEFKTMPDIKQRILLPCSSISSKIFVKQLRRTGAQVVSVVVYRTAPLRFRNSLLVKRLINGDVDIVTFTSPSCVKGFYRIIGLSRELGRINRKVKFVSIGPVTTQAAKEMGFRIDITAKEHTIDGLIKCIEKYKSNHKFHEFHELR